MNIFPNNHLESQPVLYPTSDLATKLVGHPCQQSEDQAFLLAFIYNAFKYLINDITQTWESLGAPTLWANTKLDPRDRPF